MKSGAFRHRSGNVWRNTQSLSREAEGSRMASSTQRFMVARRRATRCEGKAVTSDKWWTTSCSPDLVA